MRPQTRKPYVNLKVTQRLRSVYALRAILQTDPNYNKLKHKKSRCMKNSSTLLYSSTGMGCMTDPPPPRIMTSSRTTVLNLVTLHQTVQEFVHNGPLTATLKVTQGHRNLSGSIEIISR